MGKLVHSAVVVALVGAIAVAFHTIRAISRNRFVDANRNMNIE